MLPLYKAWTLDDGSAWFGSVYEGARFAAKPAFHAASKDQLADMIGAHAGATTKFIMIQPSCWLVECMPVATTTNAKVRAPTKNRDVAPTPIVDDVSSLDDGDDDGDVELFDLFG
jgi:hypothetical protein